MDENAIKATRLGQANEFKNIMKDLQTNPEFANLGINFDTGLITHDLDGKPIGSNDYEARRKVLESVRNKLGNEFDSNNNPSFAKLEAVNGFADNTDYTKPNKDGGGAHSKGDALDVGTITLNDGTVKSFKNYDKEGNSFPHKCTKYCGDFVPLRDNGEYLVNLDKTILHQKPSRSSKKLAELNRNDRVNVTEDSGKIETILPHTATWAKVQAADGTEGYVFGAYIRMDDEVDYEGIKEKAKEWKKLNGK